MPLNNIQYVRDILNKTKIKMENIQQKNPYFAFKYKFLDHIKRPQIIKKS